jgi:hypothetical protein
MLATVTPPTPLIDWHSLWQVLSISLIISVGVIIIFTIGVHSLSTYRRQGSSLSLRIISGLTMSLAVLGIVVTLAWGFYYVVQK